MANDTQITVVGNLTADPELRYLQNGTPVANGTIASTPRKFNKQTNEWEDQEALFLRFSVFREYAEHVAGSLTKGMRVIAQGNLKQRSYQDKEGNTRTSMELEIEEIGPSLRYATAQVVRATQGQGGQYQQQPVQQAQPQQGPPQGAPQQGAYPVPTQAVMPQQGAYPAPQQQPQQGPPTQQMPTPQNPGWNAQPDAFNQPDF